MEILILLLTICKSNKAYRQSHIQFVIFYKIPNSRDPAVLVQYLSSFLRITIRSYSDPPTPERPNFFSS